jgi:hypothetical protein
MIPELTDKRGTKIEVGVRVAYNLSGDVALGTVAKVSDKKFAGYPGGSYTYCFILVTPDSEWSKIASKTGVSKIKVHLTYGNLVDKVVVLSTKEAA